VNLPAHWIPRSSRGTTAWCFCAENSGAMAIWFKKISGDIIKPHQGVFMAVNTDVLIVGGGPTGLMLACQLRRFGVSFKIIDKQADRAHESRAFGIQAKSMEIFQNLGIVDNFLKKAFHHIEPCFFVNGKLKLKLNLNKIKLKNTSFPSIYFLPQSETEKYLIEHLENHGVNIQRKISLDTFHQSEQDIKAVLKHEVSGELEEITCRYLVGCDGAHSLVRNILQIPFVGASYEQDFFLADLQVEWPSPPESRFMIFFDTAGFFLHAPLGDNLSRIIGAKISQSTPDVKTPLTVAEITDLSKKITHRNITISNPVWMSRFHLHHRSVTQYQKGRVFLAGDAAHIHSPVAAQGMNTGLQDATNLGWKIAAVLKNHVSEELLQTYQIEREAVGRKLNHSTDRFFGFLTSRNPILMGCRPLFLSLIMKLLKLSSQMQKSLFWFMSELGIRYEKNKYVEENTRGADSRFLAGPDAGSRAPDAPLAGSTLFEIFKENHCHVLIFIKTNHKQALIHEHKVKALETAYQKWIKFHLLTKSRDTKTIFKRYHVSNTAIYFIRPDGYIGFRESSLNFDKLSNYLKKLLGEGET
jgi:2-polyprenyl-6-methoxyphenol hydroxylase-like FAD-dependent oxidoreductase